MRICIGLTMLLATVALPRESLACRCVPAPVSEALSAADAVFLGRVISLRLANPDAPEGEAPTIIEFRVLRKWKGIPNTRMTLHTHRNLFSCQGYEFALGDSYVVFARKNSLQETKEYWIDSNKVTYGVSLCGGTTSSRDPGTAEREKQLAKLTHHE